MPDVSIADQTHSDIGQNLGRREFFFMGPAAGVACLASIQGLVAAGPQPEDSSACSIAYCKEATKRLVKPEDLWSGDRDLVDEEIQLTVHGIGPDSREWIDSGIESCSLTVHFRSDAGIELPFGVWEFDNRQALNIGSPIRISVPVRGSGLRLGVNLVRGGSDYPGHEKEFCFLPGFALGRAKLRRGVYCLAVGQEDKTPSWNSYRFQGDVPEGSSVTREYCVQARSGQPADFPYLVFSVDASKQL